MEWLRRCSWPTRQENMTAAMFTPSLPAAQSALSEIVAEFHVEKVQPEIILIKISSSNSIGRQSGRLEVDATKERLQLQPVEEVCRVLRDLADAFVMICLF